MFSVSDRIVEKVIKDIFKHRISTYQCALHIGVQAHAGRDISEEYDCIQIDPPRRLSLYSNFF